MPIFLKPPSNRKRISKNRQNSEKSDKETLQRMPSSISSNYRKRPKLSRPPKSLISKFGDGFQRIKSMMLLDTPISDHDQSSSNSLINSKMSNSKRNRLSFRSDFSSEGAKSQFLPKSVTPPQKIIQEEIVQQIKQADQLFQTNHLREFEILRFRAQNFIHFLEKFKYLCRIIFVMNFWCINSVLESKTYYKWIPAIIISLAIQQLQTRISEPKYEKLDRDIGIVFYLSQFLIFEYLMISNKLTLILGMVNIQLCGMHLLSLSQSKFYKKIKMWLPTIFYILGRLFYDAEHLCENIGKYDEIPLQINKIVKQYVNDAQMQFIISVMLDPMCFFSLVQLVAHIYGYDQKKNEFYEKSTTKLIRQQKIWENISIKNSIGMCLFNIETKQIEFHNEALETLLGTKTKVGNAVLRPKKKKLQIATKECLDKVYKEVELHQQAIILDKNPQTLLQVLRDVVRTSQINAQNKCEQDYLNRYHVVNTSKNIVVSAKNISLNFNEYSILVFYEIDQIQQFEHMKQLQRFDKQFTSCLAHDLLTPVNHILGINQMLHQQLKNDSLDEEHLKKSMKIQHSAIEQMQSMIYDMLDLSQLRSDTFKFKNTTFEIRDLAQKIFEIIKVQSDMKGLKLKLKIDEDVPKTILSDPQRIKQIIMNIVGNAIKYTNKGYVYFHVKLDKTYVNHDDDLNWARLEISVRDTGCGISKENVKKFFKLFGEVKSTKKINQTGIGLGLAICKSLIQQFMGEINVDTRVGKGSKFTFKILVIDQTIQRVYSPKKKRSGIRNTSTPQTNLQATMTKILEMQTIENIGSTERELQHQLSSSNQSLSRSQLNYCIKKVEVFSDCNFEVSYLENSHDRYIKIPQQLNPKFMRHQDPIQCVKQRSLKSIFRGSQDKQLVTDYKKFARSNDGMFERKTDVFDKLRHLRSPQVNPASNQLFRKMQSNILLEVINESIQKQNYDGSSSSCAMIEQINKQMAELRPKIKLDTQNLISPQQILQYNMMQQILAQSQKHPTQQDLYPESSMDYSDRDRDRDRDRDHRKRMGSPIHQDQQLFQLNKTLIREYQQDFNLKKSKFQQNQDIDNHSSYTSNLSSYKQPQQQKRGNTPKRMPSAFNVQVESDELSNLDDVTSNLYTITQQAVSVKDQKQSDEIFNQQVKNLPMKQRSKTEKPQKTHFRNEYIFPRDTPERQQQY